MIRDVVAKDFVVWRLLVSQEKQDWLRKESSANLIQRDVVLEKVMIRFLNRDVDKGWWYRYQWRLLIETMDKEMNLASTKHIASRE